MVDGVGKLVPWCLVMSFHCHSVLAMVTYYMIEKCSKGLVNMGDDQVHAGRLRLTHENWRYREDMFCRMTIRAPEDHHLMVRFLDMEIEGFMSEGCVSDYMKIYDGPSDTSPSMGNHRDIVQYPKTPANNRICGTLTPRASYVTTSNEVTFMFRSDRSVQYRGFDLFFTAFHTGDCDSGEFLCKNGRCINSTLQCNDYNNCGDDSDYCGPGNSLIIFLVLLCVAVFVFLVTSVIRCTYQDNVRKFPKSSLTGTDNDLIRATTGIRVSSFRGFSRRDSSRSADSSIAPQEEPLLNESQSSV